MFFGAPGAEALPRLPSWPHWNGTGAFPAVCLLALVSLRPSVQFFSLQPRLLFLGRSAFALHESLLAAPASSIGFPSNFLSLSLAAPSRWSGTVGGSSVRSRLVAAEAAAPSKVCPAIESGVYFPDKSTSLEMQTVIAKAKLTLKNLS